MSSIPRLSLGALFRAMRAGLDDATGERVILDFHQLTAQSPGGAPSAPPAALRLQALIEMAGGGLDRAEVSLDAPSAVRWVQFQRDGAAGYAYSVDGGRGWGRFRGSPRIFDLGEFEAALDGVSVDDVTFEPVPQDEWSGRATERVLTAAVGSLSPSLPVQALDVSLGRAAFTRLMRIFAADLGEEEEEPLALISFSVSIAASEEVSLLCWWSLHGPAASSPSRSPQGAGLLQVTCSVSLRVASIEASAPEEVVVDDSLPLVGRVDDVWELLRRA